MDRFSSSVAMQGIERLCRFVKTCCVDHMLAPPGSKQKWKGAPRQYPATGFDTPEQILHTSENLHARRCTKILSASQISLRKQGSTGISQAALTLTLGTDNFPASSPPWIQLCKKQDILIKDAAIKAYSCINPFCAECLYSAGWAHWRVMRSHTSTWWHANLERFKSPRKKSTHCKREYRPL